MIFMTALIVFAAFLGAIPLFDWDEVNFAEIAREMILTGDYGRVYIDFIPFWEKPPLFFWLQALSMHIWGVGEFAARFPNAICGAVTLSALYLIGRKHFDHRFGLLWTLAFGGSILPHLYFRSGIIDPWFNLFIFLSIVMIIRFLDRKDNNLLVFAGLLLGLAVLTKGPVAWLIVALVTGVYWLLKRFRTPLGIPRFALYSVVALLTFGMWYGIETVRNGPWFLTQFIRYQYALLVQPGAGHAGFPGYHVVILLLGCFPASLLALRPVFQTKEGTFVEKLFGHWMLLLLIVVVVLFSLVQSKIVHYSSLCYFPITFFATQYVWRLSNTGNQIGRWQKAGIVMLGMLYVVAVIALVWFGMRPEGIHELVTLDANAKAALAMDITWRWWHVLPVVCILTALTFLLIPGLAVYPKAILLYSCFALFTWTGVACWVGKVQQYSQGPATEFFSSLRGKDVYAVPWGYKSYSQYWDFRKPVPDGFQTSADDFTDAHRRYSDADFLLTSPDIGRDVYVVVKTSKAGEFAQRHPDAERIGQKGSFVFFVKRAD